VGTAAVLIEGRERAGVGLGGSAGFEGYMKCISANRFLHLCFAAICFAWSMTCCSFWSVSALRPQLAR